MQSSWIGTILIRDLETVKAELGAFPDDASVWATPAGITNSAGTLALHLAGNIRWFIGAKLGGDGYVRDREREFAVRGVPRAELAAGLDQAIAAVRRVLGPDSRIDFAASFPEAVGGMFELKTGDFLVHLAAHLGFHLGQIDYLRRLVTGVPASVTPVALGRLETALKVG